MNIKQDIPRLPCSETELKICQRLEKCSLAWTSFDKMFCKNLHEIAQKYGLSLRQKEALKLLFHKYRKQIPDYEELNGQLTIRL